MALFNNFPYTNFHELNLDWILAKIKELEALVSDVPTEGGLDAVRAELEVLRGQLTAAVAGLERDIDGLTASDVGALPNTVTKLPSPASLTFTGAAAGSYDGSQAVTINIPAGGGGGGGGGGAPLNFTGRQTATYDGSQTVDINLPEKLASPNAITFTGGVTGTYDGSAPMTVNIPTGGSGDIQNQPLTFSGAVTASYDGSEQVSVNIPVAPTTLPNPNALTFTGAVTGTYDGSAPLSVVIPQGGGGDGRRYRFIGTINVETASGQGAGSVVIPIGSDYHFQTRDVLIVEYDPYNTNEYSGTYTATMFWDAFKRPNSIYLSAVFLGEFGASHALGRSVTIQNAGDASGIEIIYGHGYIASIGQSGTTSANNGAIGIKRIHILRQNL